MSTLPYGSTPVFINDPGFTGANQFPDNHLFVTDQPANDMQKSCYHDEWKEYHGFTEFYRYCTTCDIKKWPKKNKASSD